MSRRGRDKFWSDTAKGWREIVSKMDPENFAKFPVKQEGGTCCSQCDAHALVGETLKHDRLCSLQWDNNTKQDDWEKMNELTELFNEFVRYLYVKVETKHKEYKGRSFSQSPEDLLTELASDPLNIAEWGFVLWVRLQKLTHKAGKLEVTNSPICNCGVRDNSQVGGNHHSHRCPLWGYKDLEA